MRVLSFWKEKPFRNIYTYNYVDGSNNNNNNNSQNQNGKEVNERKEQIEKVRANGEKITQQIAKNSNPNRIIWLVEKK